MDQGNSNSAVVSPTCVLSMHPQYQVFLSANDARLSRGNDSSQPEKIITRKNFTDPNCMFLFLCQHAITYKQHRTCNNVPVTITSYNN